MLYGFISLLKKQGILTASATPKFFLTFVQQSIFSESNERRIKNTIKETYIIVQAS